MLLVQGGQGTLVKADLTLRGVPRCIRPCQVDTECLMDYAVVIGQAFRAEKEKYDVSAPKGY